MSQQQRVLKQPPLSATSLPVLALSNMLDKASSYANYNSARCTCSTLQARMWRKFTRTHRVMHDAPSNPTITPRRQRHHAAQAHADMQQCQDDADGAMAQWHGKVLQNEHYEDKTRSQSEHALHTNPWRAASSINTPLYKRLRLVVAIKCRGLHLPP
jgi:hypothetical protein